MWHKIEFWATTRSTHIWFSCTMSYVTFLPSLENAQCNTSKYIYFIFCGETFLLMKDKKPREYFKLSFIVPVAISKTHFQHKSDWYNYLHILYSAFLFLLCKILTGFNRKLLFYIQLQRLHSNLWQTFSFLAKTKNKEENYESRWWWRKLGDLGYLGVFPLCNTPILVRLWNHFVRGCQQKCMFQIHPAGLLEARVQIPR